MVCLPTVWQYTTIHRIISPVSWYVLYDQIESKCLLVLKKANFSSSEEDVCFLCPDPSLNHRPSCGQIVFSLWRIALDLWGISSPGFVCHTRSHTHRGMRSQSDAMPPSALPVLEGVRGLGADLLRVCSRDRSVERGSRHRESQLSGKQRCFTFVLPL